MGTFEDVIHDLESVMSPPASTTNNDTTGVGSP